MYETVAGKKTVCEVCSGRIRSGEKAIALQTFSGNRKRTEYYHTKRFNTERISRLRFGTLDRLVDDILEDRKLSTRDYRRFSKLLGNRHDVHALVAEWAEKPQPIGRFGYGYVNVPWFERGLVFDRIARYFGL